MNRRLPTLLLACVILAGCSRSEPPADFVFINGAEPESLDPAIITGQPEGRIVMGLFEGLTAHDEKAGVVPGVAERWEISPDGKHYTFHLRHDARWSNGDAVTSHDFVRSWRRTLAPETLSEYAYQLYYILNGQAFNEGTINDPGVLGVRARDDFTLEVELNNPASFFLDLCSTPPLYPVHMPTVEKHGGGWIKPGRMVCNGAYILEAWRLNDRIRLRANPHYWDRANVRSKTMDILPTSQPTTAFNIYSTGGADLMLDKGLVPFMLLNKLRTRPDFHSGPFFGNMFIRFNVKRPAFSDPKVRKAFALAVDKQRLVTKITRQGETIADSLVPPIPGYTSPKGLGYDPDQARALLAAAGYPGGKGFPEVAYLYTKSDLNEGIATELQDMFAKTLGVKIQLRPQEWKVYLKSMSDLDFDLCRSSWVGDYPDANTFMDMFVTDGGNNRTGWSSKAYDALIAEAAKELDASKRNAIFQQAEKLLCSDEVPIVPLYYYVGVQFYDPAKVTGVEPNFLDDHPLKYFKKVIGDR